MIYVLDTNVVSEIMKPEANWGVIDWIQDHNESVFLSAISVHELYYGIYLLPDSKRKTHFLELMEGFTRDRVGMILPFDAFAGYLCGKLYAEARKNGRPGTIEDCMIAAICMRNGATLVTRNTKDFEQYGIDLIDPFDYEPPLLQELREREKERS